MYLLDTDHMSVLERGGARGEALRSRLRAVPPDEVATTIISYEEQTRGWLAQIARARTLASQVELYGYLKHQLLNYCVIAVVDFDDQAVAQCERLRQARIRIGTMDLKIAAIALVNDAILLTRNLTDFGKVPGLRVQDWTS